MSNMFKVGDIVTLRPDYKEMMSDYDENRTLNVWSRLVTLVGEKLVIRSIHKEYYMLYRIDSWWFHENWLEYLDEKFEFDLDEELFLI